MKLSEFQQSKAKGKALKVAGAVLAILWLASHYSRPAQVWPVMAVQKPAPLVATEAPAAPMAKGAPVAVAVAAPAPAPSVVAPAPVVAGAPVAPDSLAGVASTFVGTWIGHGDFVTQPPHGRTCDLAIEVKRQDTAKDKVAPFEVFSTLNCVFQGLPRHPPIRDVTSFALSGDGLPGAIPAIDFDTVTNAVGVKESVFGCSMQSMKLVNFGAGRISAGWKEAPGGPACNGGEIVMVRRRFY